MMGTYITFPLSISAIYDAVCMPEEHYTWLPQQDLLSVKEISAIIDVFLSVGVSKVQITGGRPLIHAQICRK